jgi:hypothetical protein
MIASMRFKNFLPYHILYLPWFICWDKFQRCNYVPSNGSYGSIDVIDLTARTFTRVREWGLANKDLCEDLQTMILVGISKRWSLWEIANNDQLARIREQGSLRTDRGSWWELTNLNLRKDPWVRIRKQGFVRQDPCKDLQMRILARIWKRGSILARICK